MDVYNFFDYVPTSDNKESENYHVPSHFHNILENVQNFEHHQEEKTEYAIIEVVQMAKYPRYFPINFP